tara:strand:- start:1331 stop:2887 length:1557 start_codon:yes stop_codon:yes gene_type:complete
MPSDRRSAIKRVFTLRLPRKQRAVTRELETDPVDVVAEQSYQSDPGMASKMKRLEELTAFYELYGHSKPPDGTSLSNWVKKMRTMKRRGELSQSFILSLNALEMDWEPAQRRRFARLEELRAFKEKEGHIQVPVGGSLERWIRRMRALYQKGKLEDDIVQELDKLGMVWAPRSVQKRKSDETFEARLDELKALVAVDGRVLRVNQYEPGMRAWIYHQQRCFREGSLSKDKVQALRDVGVTLKMTQRISWDTRLMELIEFKRTHGHCNVPATWRHNKELGSWVGTQRKYMRNGKLSEERVAALTSIGFEWEPRKALSRGVRAKASPWTVSQLSAKSEGPNVRIEWIGGDDKKPPSNDTFTWGRASENYEEKQQIVYDEIEQWWKVGSESAADSPQSCVRGMRLNHRLKVGKNTNFKPDILLEILSDTPQGGAITWGLVVEVDEFGHRRGSKSYTNEEKRMSEVQKTLDVPIKFVRFNPDPTQEDARELESRIPELLDHLYSAVARPPLRDLEVSYIAYD